MNDNDKYLYENGVVRSSVPLMVVAGAHSRVLSSAGAGFGAAATWRALAPPAEPAAGAGAAGAGAACAPVPAAAAAARPVPLLLRDPLALLMQFLLLAPPTPPYLDMREYDHSVLLYFNC